MSNQRVQWKALVTLIPNSVTINKNKYEVLWMDNLPENYGEVRFYTKQIILCTKSTDKQKVITYFHELVHIISEECGLDLSENKVLATENIFPDLLKPGNVLKSNKKGRNRGKTTTRNKS